MEILGKVFKQIRKKTPIIHFLTNYVTVNDCANITLACGGSPIMADEIKEVEQIAALSSALVLNIGTANERTFASMLCAGKYANRFGIPIVLDPAGAGASRFRDDVVCKLLQEIDFTIIKGNISEIKFLSDGFTSTQGVDAADSDLVNEDNLKEVMVFSKKLSIITGSIIIITGPIDIVADHQTGYAIRNGHPLMPSVTGTGCMSGAVAGCFLGANANQPLEAAVASTVAMGICGELV